MAPALPGGDGVRRSADCQPGWRPRALDFPRARRSAPCSRPSPAACARPRPARAPMCRCCARGNGAEISAALFGVGYILGPRVGTVMVGGGLLSSLVIIPIIATWGAVTDDAVLPGNGMTIAQMSAGADLVALRPLHRCGRRRDGRHHHADPQHPDDDRELPGGRRPDARARQGVDTVEGHRATCRSRSPSPAPSPSS